MEDPVPGHQAGKGITCDTLGIAKQNRFENITIVNFQGLEGQLAIWMMHKQAGCENYQCTIMEQNIALKVWFGKIISGLFRFPV